MEVSLPTRRAILGVIIARGVATPRSNRMVLQDVRSMESGEGILVATFADFEPLLRRWRRSNQFGAGPARALAVSPDGTALCWGVARRSGERQLLPFLIVESLTAGAQPVWLEGQDSTSALGISFGGEVIVAKVIALAGRNRWALLAIDLRSGMAIHDLTGFVKDFAVSEIEDISVSGSGTLVAIGSQRRVQVLHIPSGTTVVSETGWIPKLSPDGQRLAFISEERLFIRSLADETRKEPLSGTRVMGAGGWSPNGRYLLAGVWTRKLSFEKRLIVLDTTTGDHGELSRLHEGDYGNHTAWVSSKFITQ